MFRNYLKIAYRSIAKNKLFSAIKIGSLAIGLSASFVIGMIIYYDLSFDTFHPDSKSIYRITSEFLSPEGNGYNPGVPYPLGEALREKAPGLVAVSPLLTAYPLEVRNEIGGVVHKNPRYVVYAHADYFKIFGYDWLAGSADKALENPNEVVLAADRAKTYFPDKSPEEILGQILVYQDTIPVKVTGIVANFEARTDLVFEEFISLPTTENADLSNVVAYSGWNNTNSSSQLFVKLGGSSDRASVQRVLDAFATEYNEEESVSRGNIRKFYAQPLADLHLDPNYYTFDFDSGRASKSVLIGLGFIAFFLLVLGCVNFINLSTAQAIQRAKEIGVRKTLGSSKRQLVFQFLAETLFLTILAAGLSIVLAFWLLGAFSDFTPSGLHFSILLEPVGIIGVLGLLAVVSLLSGFYPALVLSKYRPVAVLKGQLGNNKEKGSLRKYLTVFQFCVAQVFVIATFLIGKQINYLMTKDMGFETAAIASVRTPWHISDQQKRLLLSERIAELPMVGKVSLSGNPPASFSSSSTGVSFFTEDTEIFTQLQLLRGDMDYLDLYGISFLAGRDRLNDSIREYVINDTYRRRLGFKTPEEALGKSLGSGDEKYPIVGVVQDFNQRSLRLGIEPMAIVGNWYPDRNHFNTVHFSFTSSNAEEWGDTLATIEGIWEEIYPDTEFQLNFMDQTIARFYENERRTSTLLQWAMGFSIAISCLGLFGLVVYTTERRTKEIGIRKVLGASVMQVNLLLCREFLVLVGVAFCLAVPIAWYGLQNWLEEFAYKTEMSIWVFLISGALMGFVALLVMSLKTLAKANTNPVKSLRTE